ncbi:endonuclease domain-containing protein [Streptomyces decoyicus]
MDHCKAAGHGWSCSRTAFCKGFCAAHYQQRERGRVLRPVRERVNSYRRKICEFEGCGKETKALGLCPGHYRQQQLGKALTPLRVVERKSCRVDFCIRTESAKGYCAAHYKQVAAGNEPTRIRARRTAQEVARMRASGYGRCYECEEVVAVERFRTSGGTGLSGVCNDCQNIRTRLARFKMTKHDYDELLAFQGGKCAVCTSDEPLGKYDEWHIDHNHACCPRGTTCGECVRGILCSECNIRGVTWYESLPVRLQTFDLLNGYLNDPPARRLREKKEATGIDTGR